MIELIWDARTHGTAVAPSGTTVTVGDEGQLSPEDLLCMAAAGCLMRTFLERATEADVPVLGYVSTARAEPVDDGMQVHVRSYVIAPAWVPADTVGGLCAEAERQSPVARALGARLVVEHEVRRIEPVEG
jgi:organic hydroperoxide reductase OsmC/OhrA